MWLSASWGIAAKRSKIFKKENAAIFSPVKNQEITVFTEEYQFDFEKLLEAYQKDSGSYIAYTKAYKQFMEDEEKEYFPVYYKPVNVGKNKTMFHIAPAAITKSKYKNRVQELLGDFNACHISTGLCPACSLFGITDSESKQRGIASRLRFGDAVLKKENKKDQIYCEKIDLQELAGPHVSNAEMYLKRPAGAVEWNYDYWVELIDGKRKFHPYNAQLNGRKFYWHHADWNLENMKAKQNTERNLTVRPVADGVTFEGELFFDNITREQLMQMIYLCDLSRNAAEDENGITKQLGYKLGMGKPVGLGSIEMRIQSVKIRSFDAAKEDFYSEETIDFSNEEERSEYAVTYEEAGFLSENHIRDWFEMLMDLNVTKGITVAYPYTDKQLENMEETVEVTDGKGWKKKRKLGGFQWFVTNKGEKKNKQYLVKEEQKKAEKIEVPYLKVLKYDTGDNRQKHMYDDKKRRDGKNKK